MSSIDSEVADFLKIAQEVTVRAHTRRVGGKSVSVRMHDRTEESSAGDMSQAKARELKLWRQWKEGGQRVEDLRPLLNSFMPILRSQMRTYKGRVAMIPDAAIEAEFKLQLVGALQSYDPDKGAALGTHIFNSLQRARRYITTYQNVGRIPENRVGKIRTFEVARTDLLEDLGRDPTQAELTEFLRREYPAQGWTAAEVDRLQRELRKDLVTQGFEVDPFVKFPSRDREILDLFVYELSGDELKVYRHLTGIGAQKITSTSTLAEKLGFGEDEAYKVSRIKSKLRKKLEHFLQRGD